MFFEVLKVVILDISEKPLKSGVLTILTLSIGIGKAFLPMTTFWLSETTTFWHSENHRFWHSEHHWPSTGPTTGPTTGLYRTKACTGQRPVPDKGLYRTKSEMSKSQKCQKVRNVSFAEMSVLPKCLFCRNVSFFAEIVSFCRKCLKIKGLVVPGPIPRWTTTVRTPGTTTPYTTTGSLVSMASVASQRLTEVHQASFGYSGRPNWDNCLKTTVF